MSKAKRKWVHVWWMDACAHRGWKEPISGTTKNLVCAIESVGWLVLDTKETIVISTSFDEDCERYMDQLAIPRGSVIRMRGVSRG